MTKNAQGFMMPDASSEFIEFSLNREDKDGLIRIFSDDFEHLYIAVLSEDEIRSAIDRCLTSAMRHQGHDNVEVFVNGSLSGPIIKTVAKLA